MPPRCGPARRGRSERVGARPTFKSAHRRAYQWSTRREGSAVGLSSETPTGSGGRPALSGTPVATAVASWTCMASTRGRSHTLPNGWTQRSCVLEGALAYIACRVGVYAVQIGNANWFGAAGWDPLAKNGQGAYRKADVVFVGFNGGGQRHLFIDVAIVDGSGATAVGGALGHAAGAREAAKVRKYQPICDRIDAQFRGAVIERHGHCGDGMCSIIKLLSGDGERDLMQEDTSFTAPSRTTYVGVCCSHGRCGHGGRRVGECAPSPPPGAWGEGLSTFSSPRPGQLSVGCFCALGIAPGTVAE